MPDNPSLPGVESEIPSVNYAFWDVPGAAFKVIYSLPLFHEIDFAVNEGYRKIPHGGIEVGGLLFGTITNNSVRIEAFHPIDCEHAYGPALHLSQRDLAELEAQIASASADRSLAPFQPIGWFLAHTRGPLELTETEVAHFARFFPQPGMVTLLVKPERFQPTRYGFLVRKADAEMPRDASNSAIILPLPGRKYKPGQLLPSIPAPASSARRAAPTPPPLPKKASRREPDDVDPVPPPAVSSLPESITGDIAESANLPEPPPEPSPSPRTPAEKAARRQLARDRVRVMEGIFPPAPLGPQVDPQVDPQLDPQVAPQAAPPASQPEPPVIRDRPTYLPAAYPRPSHSRNNRGAARAPRSSSVATRSGSVLTGRSITVLALAALLGCLVGYIGYLQLPAPVIPLNVHASSKSIVVSWPPEETRNSIYAAIRFNDGAPVPLSVEERNSGQVSLADSKDFKVEVMARNWVRDSRGIIRYLHSPNPAPNPVPTATLP